MVADIQKMITSNKLTSNLLKSWGSNYDRKAILNQNLYVKKHLTNLLDQAIKSICKSISTPKYVTNI